MRDDTLYFLFLKTIKLHRLKMNSYLDKINIYPGQPHVLLTLYHEGEKSQSEIANKINIRPATLTVMLKKLESENLIGRKKDENDSRINKVYLTDKGMDTIKVIEKVHHEIKDICFSNLTKEEEEQFEKILKKINNNIQNTNK